MTSPWTTDPYPTAKCPAARERVIELHRSYHQLLRDEPTRQRIEAEVLEEEKKLTITTEPATDPAAEQPTKQPTEQATVQAAEPAAEPAERPHTETSPEPPAEAPDAAPALSRSPGAPRNEPVAAPPVQPPAPDPSAMPAVEAEALVPAAAPLPVAGALSERALENLQEVARRPRATAERNRLEKMQKESAAAKKGWLAALYLVGLWTSWGLATVLGNVFREQVVAKLDLAVPAPVITAPFAFVLAGLVLFACLGLARSLQLHRTGRKGPRDIPYVDTVGHIYETELYHSQPLELEQELQLAKKLETLRKTLIGGKTPDEALEDLRLFQAFFGVIALIFAVPNFLFYPHASIEEGVVAFLIATGPVAFVFFFTMLLSNHTIAWPRLAEELTDPSVAQGKVEDHKRRIEEARTREEKARLDRAEAERLAEKQRAQRMQDEDRTRSKTLEDHARDRAKQIDDEERARLRLEQERQRIETEKAQAEARLRAQDDVKRAITLRFEHASKSYKVETQDRYADLLEAAHAFEMERGYSKKEQTIMQEELKRARTMFWWLLVPASALSGIVATYPASLTINEIFGLRFQYMFHNRFAVIPWLLWILVIIAAETLMVMSRHRVSAAEEQHRVLTNFYEEGERITGLRYRLKTASDLLMEKASARWMLGAGIALLSLEFAANAAYLIKNSDANMTLAVLLALVPLTLFVALTWPHAQNHHKRNKLHESLNWARSLPIPAPPPDPNALAPSRSARDAYEQLTGYVDPSAPRREG